jgi:DNA polymerase-3 subunit gamma/tau
VAQTARFGRADLSRAAELVADGLMELKGATAPRLLLELICARVLLPGADHGTEGLLARLDRIEKRMSIEGTPSAAAPVPAPAPPDAGPPRPVEPPSPVEPVEAAQPVDSGRPVEPPQPVEPFEPLEPAGTSSGLTLVDVRRLWPDLLDAVKLKRRYTWILLSQNAQVADVDDKTLTIALVNAGARNSFTSGGSEEILRQAAIDVIGHDWRVESIVDPSAQPGSEPRVEITRRAVPEQREVTSRSDGPESAPGPGAIAHARGAIVDTRPAGGARGRRGSDVSDEDADRDDPDADDHGLGGAELLERELGASIIEEIKHD